MNVWLRVRGVVLLSLVLCGCMVGPDYKRPKLAVPAQFRGAAPAAAQPGAALTELARASVFADPLLGQMIDIALRDNLDVAAAANRILQAEAQLGVTRSFLFPSIGGAVRGVDGRVLPQGTSQAVNGGQYAVGARLSWELDFWGKLRRGTESAKAQVMGAEWARRAIVTTLVSQLATAYFETSAIEQQLELARRAIVAREESLRLTQVRSDSGAGSLVDVRQAEELVYGARAQEANLNRLLTQHENALSFLMGHNPGSVTHRPSLPEPKQVAPIPTGLPSTLLSQRSDVQQAEADLAAKTAAIGVARGAFFPQFILTADGGLASASLASAVSTPALLWTIGASIAQPLFNAGRLVKQARFAELQRDESMFKYRRIVQQALREVSDGLIGYQRGAELRDAQAKLLEAAREARHLSDLRYQGGTTTYLQVLDSETRLFEAELALVQANLTVQLSFVEVYRALGGGWSDGDMGADVRGG